MNPTFGMPVALYSNALTMVANARTRLSSEQSIRCPYTSGMWVEEVHFSQLPVPSAAAGGWLTSAQFTVGPHKLMNDFVPIYTLCPMEDGISQQATVYATWKLPKPLFLRAGDVLSPEFLNRDSSTRNMRLLIKGRQNVGPPPQTIDVPWVAAFRGQSLSGTTDTRENSSQADLVNPFKKVLHLERFTGAVIDPTTTYNGYDTFTNDTALFTAYFLRMIASDGKIIVRDRTPWASVFNLSDNCWWVKGKLGPREWVTAYIDELLSVKTAVAGTTVNIAMVGHREENL